MHCFNAFSVTLLLCILLLSISLPLRSQQLYVGARVGYAVPATSDNLASTFRNEVGESDYMLSIVNSDTLISDKVIYGSNGGGINAGITVGYMFNNNIGLETNLSYVASGEVTLAQRNTPTYQSFHKIHTQRLEVAPTLIMQTGGEKLKFFTKVGVVFPFWGINKSEIVIEEQEGALASVLLGTPIAAADSYLEAEALTKARFAYGVSSSVGVLAPLGNKINFFAELRYVGMTVKPKKTTYEDFYVLIQLPDAENPFITEERTLDMLEVIQKEINYVNELTHTSNNETYNSQVDNNKPQDELSFKQSYSNVGLHIGINFVF